MIDVQGEPTYHGTVTLIKWTDSDSGMYVTFALNPGEAGQVHPFKHLRQGSKKGQSFALVAVPITENDELPAAATGATPSPETPANPPTSPSASKAGGAKKGSLTVRAVLLCEDRVFQGWLGVRGRPETIAQDTARHLRERLGISSRAELNHDADAALRFIKLESEFLTATGRLPDPRG